MPRNLDGCNLQLFFARLTVSRFLINQAAPPIRVRQPLLNQNPASRSVVSVASTLKTQARSRTA